MNPTQMGGLVRDAVKGFSLLIVGLGVIPGGTWVEILAGAAGYLGGLYWTWHVNKTPVMVAAVAATSDKADGVKAVVMNTTAVADSIPAPNVVGPSGH